MTQTQSFLSALSALDDGVRAASTTPATPTVVRPNTAPRLDVVEIPFDTLQPGLPAFVPEIPFPLQPGLPTSVPNDELRRTYLHNVAQQSRPHTAESIAELARNLPGIEWERLPSAVRKWARDLATPTT